VTGVRACIRAKPASAYLLSSRAGGLCDARFPATCITLTTRRRFAANHHARKTLPDASPRRVGMNEGAKPYLFAIPS